MVDYSKREKIEPRKMKPYRAEEQGEKRICLVCQNLVGGDSNTKCSRCGYSENDVKQRAFLEYHSMGASGF